MSWNSSGKSKGATPVPVLYARTRRSIAERKKAEREALGPVLFYGTPEKKPTQKQCSVSSLPLQRRTLEEIHEAHRRASEYISRKYQTAK